MGIRVTVTGGLGDTARDFRSKPTELARGSARVSRESAKDGRDTAKRIARRTAGAHGKHYPKSITSERRGPSSYEYGPDPALPQGGMSFERGSRNQPPHLDIARSADLMAPGFYRSVDSLLDGIFRG